MKKFKILELKLEKRCHELRASGASYSEIANTLTQEAGHKISRFIVQKYLQGSTKARTEIMQKSRDIKVEELELFFQAHQQLIDLNKNMKELYEILVKEGKYREAIQASNNILHQVELVLKVLGEIKKEVQAPVTINYLDLSQKIVHVLPDLEKQGFIKILKRPPTMPEYKPELDR